jgi:hypothetical protein
MLSGAQHANEPAASQMKVRPAWAAYIWMDGLIFDWRLLIIRH